MMNSKHKVFANECELTEYAAAIALKCRRGMVIYLHGPLGAGKTTFARGFLRGLGYTGKVKSPSYTLVEPYHLSGLNVYHFDFYRLQVAEQLTEIGIQDYFTSDAICLIEWPEKGFPLLPAPDLSCYIEFDDTGRRVRFEGHTPGWIDNA